jgi:hypothetical protein
VPVHADEKRAQADLLDTSGPWSSSAMSVADAILVRMWTTRAKVVNSKIVIRTKFPNDAELYLVADGPQPEPEAELEDDDEKAADEAMASVRRGEDIPLVGRIVRLTALDTIPIFEHGATSLYCEMRSSHERE